MWHSFFSAVLTSSSSWHQLSFIHCEKNVWRLHFSPQYAVFLWVDVLVCQAVQKDGWCIQFPLLYGYFPQVDTFFLHTVEKKQMPPSIFLQWMGFSIHIHFTVFQRNEGILSRIDLSIPICHVQRVLFSVPKTCFHPFIAENTVLSTPSYQVPHLYKHHVFLWHMTTGHAEIQHFSTNPVLSGHMLLFTVLFFLLPNRGSLFSTISYASTCKNYLHTFTCPTRQDLGISNTVCQKK